MDHWTITAGTSENITLTITIGGDAYVKVLSIAGVTSQADGIAKIRAYVTAFRNEVNKLKTVPAAVASAIGYGEDF